MQPMLAEFEEIADGIALAQAVIPIVSNVTGEVADEGFGSAPYWTRHVRETVRFADSARSLESAGVTRFCEVGPNSGLIAAIEQTLPNADISSASVLWKDRAEATSLFTAMGQMFVTGVGVDWGAVFGGCGAGWVELPTYAFERRRFWLSGGGPGSGDVAGVGLGGCEHALLGAVVVSPDGHSLQHADGTPFFWLGDTVWNGALLAAADDWQRFLRDRAGKLFFRHRVTPFD